MAELVKAPWSDWETVRMIGRGSFGTVYEIQRKLVDEDTESAALKVITIPQNPSDVEELYSEGYDDESITATFISHLKSIVAEYSLMRKMDGSANIVNCKDIRYIQHDDGIGWDIFIRMELLTPLMKALPADTAEQTIIKIGKDICNALVLCKKHEIIHRDIKPQNIFVSSNGDYKLGDFGIAKTVEKTMGGTKIGTYKYMAPEVYNNQPYGSAADIYSLGLVLYWLLNERRMPFMPLPPAKLGAGMDEEARHRRLSGEKLPAPAHGSDELKQIVLKACAYDPKDRYTSAAAMLDDLNKLTGGMEPITPVIIHEEESEEAKTTGPLFGKNNISKTDTAKADDSDKTVGPDFGRQDPETELDAEKTVGPQFDKGKRPLTEEPKKKKHVLPIVLGAVAALLVTGAALFFLQPQYSEWSEWSTSEPEQIPGRKIETSTEYRTRELLLLSTDNMGEVVGEVDHEEMGYGDWGEWGEWQTDEIAVAEGLDVEENTQYRYRKKDYTTSTQSSMSGWTQYDVSTVSDWGPWSGWQTQSDLPASSATREVDVRTNYYLNKELIRPSDDGGYYRTVLGRMEGPVDSPDKLSYGSYVVLETNPSGYESYPGNTEGSYIQTMVSWNYSYRFRDWGTTSTYYYYRWGDWTEWSLTEEHSSEEREVETRQVYRSRECEKVPIYYFYDWSDWSDWGLDTVVESEECQVETRVVYRYADRE